MSKPVTIAGGVIALLAFWLLRRRNRQRDVVVPAVDLTQEPFLGMPSIHHDGPSEPRPSATGYRPSSASFISSSALSPPSQSTQSPPPSGSISLPIIIPGQKSQHSRTLTQQRDDLAEEIRRIGATSGPDITTTTSANTSASAQHTQELESRVRELQNQMEVLTREMRYQQMVPPEYEEGGSRETYSGSFELILPDSESRSRPPLVLARSSRRDHGQEGIVRECPGTVTRGSLKLQRRYGTLRADFVQFAALRRTPLHTASAKRQPLQQVPIPIRTAYRSFSRNRVGAANHGQASVRGLGGTSECLHYNRERALGS
ncbi:hypothetical protein C8F01DRAFT_1094440 [Mycena amicta]|nr:hypothetical protein C8F01DRAFT_1094440 [Mycena amicta]